ncbi:hypothetical protein pb186bvf_000032 [Paramecium bursaria]
MPKVSNQFVQFGSKQLPFSQLFILRKYVYATVNLKPVLPNHVLVCSRRPVKRLHELTEIETVEFWITVQEVAKVLTEQTKMNCDITIQDGKEAGQTVEHLHCHIIPIGKQKVINLDKTIEEKSEQDMTNEAYRLRAYFEQSLL